MRTVWNSGQPLLQSGLANFAVNESRGCHFAVSHIYKMKTMRVLHLGLTDEQYLHVIWKWDMKTVYNCTVIGRIKFGQGFERTLCCLITREKCAHPKTF